MQRILSFLLLSGIFLAGNANAQIYYPVTHTSGTQLVGGINTTVTSGGLVGSLNYCGADPFRIGSINTPTGLQDGYGYYNFSFSSPVTAFRIIVAGLNPGEVDSVFVNGVYYPLPGSSFSTYTGSCNQLTAQILNGNIVSNPVSSGGPGSGGQIDVNGSTISSIRISANGISGGSGNAFSLLIATTGVFASNNGPLCVGATLNLTATPIAGATYTWTGPNGFTATGQNVSRPNVTTADAGVYTVTAISGGVPATGTTTVSINTAPPAPSVTSAVNYCQGAGATPLTAIALAGNTLRWYTVPTAGIASVTAPTPSTLVPGTTNYYVSQTNGSCEGPRAVITVVVNAQPIPPFIFSSSPQCVGSVLNLYAPAYTGGTYNWTGPNGFTDNNRNPFITNVTQAASGIYSLTVTVNGCTSAPGITSVTINPAPTVSNATGNNPVTCGGSDGSIFINGVAPNTTFTVSYTPNGVTPVVLSYTSSSIGRITIPNLSAGTYSSITITLNGCSSTVTNSVTLVAPTASPTPPISSNSPVCTGGTIALSTPSAGPYQWSGPNGFTSSLQNPTIANATAVNAGAYQLIVTTASCPSLPAMLNVTVIPTPSAPTITSNSPVCTGDTIKLLGNAATGAVFSWSGPNGFTSASRNPVIPNAAAANAGTYTLAVTVSGCVASGTGSAVVVVNPLPAAPAVTNVTYCSGEIAAPLVATAATGNTLRFYTTATGGAGSIQAPTPNTLNGTTTYYISQVNGSGCESPRTPLIVTITTIPGPIVSSPLTLCQFQIAARLTAIGDSLRWYTVPMGGTPSTVAPIPNTTLPGTFNYYVTQKIGACTSPRAQIIVIVNPKPAPPGVTTPLRLCQYDTVALSADGQNVRWYLNPVGGGGQSPFFPPTGGINDSTFYYATQTVAGCESDRSRLLVTVTYKPNGIITPNRIVLCQNESDSFYYYGNARPDAVYNWTSPHPQTAEVSGAGTQGPYVVRFDSAGTYYVSVQVNNRGCLSDIARQPITVRPAPALTFSGKEDACVDEVIRVALSQITTGIDSFDYDFGGASVKYGAGSGGPYGIVFSTPGEKTITNTAFHKGCPSRVTPYTINVHPLPDARFTITTSSGGGVLCTGDSLTLTARNTDSNTHFVWTPDNFFESGNVYTAKGFLSKSGYISLTETSEFGCRAADSILVKTETCCQVYFPNAFSPNGDTHNELFRPVSRGNHEVKSFRVLNRWGQVVYESQDEKRGWDGVYNGKAQDAGTYYYVFIYKCGQGGGDATKEELKEKGEFLLIR